MVAKLLCAALVPLALVLSSCDSSSGPKLHPVHGKVLFQDQPTAGATVVFHAVTGGGADDLKPSGVVSADGSFTLQTYPHGEGAPEGEYIVLVTLYPENARELDNPASKLPAKYADQNAGLIKATIKAGSNELAPFLLVP